MLVTSLMIVWVSTKSGPGCTCIRSFQKGLDLENDYFIMTMPERKSVMDEHVNLNIS